MQRKLLLGILPMFFMSSFVLSHSVFAENLSDNAQNSAEPTKTLSVKALASKQAKVSENLIALEAKLADKAASSTDKDLMDQANLVQKASEEAKKAADDLDQAAKLSKKRG